MMKSHPKQILFSYYFKNLMIGYGGLVNINWHHKRAEVSFLLNPERVIDVDCYSVDFSSFLGLIKLMSFEYLKLNRLFTETYEFRVDHISILESNNFNLEGILKKHILQDGKYINSLLHGFVNE